MKTSKPKLLNQKEILKKIEDSKPKLTPFSFNNFLDREDKKEYYVNKMFAVGTINMIYSPPQSMKSFLSYYLGLCLATGTSFLNQKTKKVNVAYFDWENPLSDIQNRVKGICSGHKLCKKDIDNFFFFPKQPTLMRNTSRYDSFVDLDLKEQLINFVKDNNIKVMFFDTLRRLGNFDENDSKAINSIKSELLDPLVNECEVCIILLHHTSKGGVQYRGSVDIEGILDTSYFIKKSNINDTLSLSIKNVKRRNNEIENLNCIVDIENESYLDGEEMLERITNVKFTNAELDNKENETDYKLVREYYITNLEMDIQYKNKELIEILSTEFNYNSTKTQNKIIKWFVDKNILHSFGENKGKYYMINPKFKTQDEKVLKDDTEEKLKLMFEDVDIIEKKILLSKFDETSLNNVLDSWSKKGWFNNAKKGFVAITELYKDENLKPIKILTKKELMLKKNPELSKKVKVEIIKPFNNFEIVGDIIYMKRIDAETYEKEGLIKILDNEQLIEELNEDII